MEFVIEKCVMLKMKSGKRETVEAKKVLNEENIGTLKEK